MRVSRFTILEIYCVKHASAPHRLQIDLSHVTLLSTLFQSQSQLLNFSFLEQMKKNQLPMKINWYHSSFNFQLNFSNYMNFIYKTSGWWPTTVLCLAAACWAVLRPMTMTLREFSRLKIEIELNDELINVNIHTADLALTSIGRWDKLSSKNLVKFNLFIFDSIEELKLN